MKLRPRTRLQPRTRLRPRTRLPQVRHRRPGLQTPPSVSMRMGRHHHASVLLRYRFLRTGLSSFTTIAIRQRRRNPIRSSAGHSTSGVAISLMSTSRCTTFLVASSIALKSPVLSRFMFCYTMIRTAAKHLTRQTINRIRTAVSTLFPVAQLSMGSTPGGWILELTLQRLNHPNLLSRLNRLNRLRHPNHRQL